MKVVHQFCVGCQEFKGVFDIDHYEKRICMECGHTLIPKEVDLEDIDENPLLDRMEKDVGG